MLRRDAERPAARRPRRRRRHRPDRDRGDLLGRAGEVAPRVLSRASVGLGPSSREARDRGLPRRARVPRLRLVPHRPEPHARRLIFAALISYPRAILLGLLQGVSELFPISSLGHSVILPRLLGWNIHQNDKYFLTFLVATHLATALVLLGFFWRDWVRILRGIGRSLRDREIDSGDTDARLGWLVVVATIPAGLIGLILEHPLRKVFASPTSAAVFLLLNGLMLFAAERLRRHAPVAQRAAYSDERIGREVSFAKSVGIGAAQAIALLPGFSRSGATMSGGLLAG